MNPTPEAVRAAKAVSLVKLSPYWERETANKIDEITNLPALKKVVEAARNTLKMIEFLGVQGPPELEPKATRTIKALRSALDKLTNPAP